MKIRFAVLSVCGLTLTLLLSGCASFQRQSHSSSSLVGFLYPDGEKPPGDNAIPELKLPLRVGLAFLPSQPGYGAAGLEAARRDQLLERIRRHFAERKFVSEIVIVPDYYLRGGKGFESLEGVRRLYNVDVMALVSHDQVTYRDQNKLSLSYLTIVGAYFIKGDRHEVTTLMDLAVVDPVSRSILLRAGGSDSRHGTTTNVDAERESRESRTKSFSTATDQLIDHFDAALTQFETDVRAGRANVRVVSRSNAATNGFGGGGAWGPFALMFIAGLLLRRRRL